MKLSAGLLTALIVAAALHGGSAQAVADLPKQTNESSCRAVAPAVAGPADRALVRGQFSDADRLFAAMPPSEETLSGQVRAQIGERQFGAALVLARRATAEYPQSAELIDALAAAYLARGEPVEALAALQRAIALNPCLARAHYDFSVYLDLSGMAASGQKELDLAYRLRPEDGLIRRAWKPTQEPVSTLDSDIADMRAIAARPTETAEQRAQVENIIDALQADKRGDCELVSSPGAEIALVPLFADGRGMPPTGSAVEIWMNGKKRQLLVDTGATGLVLSFEAAKGLGLVPEAQVTSSGVGDGGASSEFVAHLATVKIGSLELRNCKVRVTSRAHGLSVQGLFGPDTLRALLLTFDFPHQRLRTGALPELEQGVGSATPRTVAESSRDRLVPAAITGWIPAFRESQSLLVPVSPGGTAQKLFVLDTGAQVGMIATDVANEITTVAARPGDTLVGVSGVTRKLGATGPMTISLKGYTGRINQMTVLDDLSGPAPEGAMRVSGFIGYDVLRNVVLDIDYRDALVHITGGQR